MRDRDWGKSKKFSEGQAHQRLDDLFFEFIALADELRPKIVIAENVTGILRGKARGYVKEIVEAFRVAGYKTQIFNLNAAQMGVPQARQRVFFIARRDDLELGNIKMKFSEKPITFGDVMKLQLPLLESERARKLAPNTRKLWARCKRGEDFGSVHPTGAMYNICKTSTLKPTKTLCAPGTHLHPTEPRWLSVSEWMACSTFPMDMDWPKGPPSKSKWFMGMSVPPFMMQRIALEIRKQWLRA